MRVDADGHGDVVDLGVGEQPVAFDFPGIEHLPAQRQHGLEFLVAAHLGRASGGIAFHQKEFGAIGIAAFAVGQLARQHGHARAFFLLHLLRRAQAALRLADDQFSELLALIHPLVQPEFERGPHGLADQTQGIAAVELFLDLALELRIEHPRGEHEGRPREEVFGQQLHALGLQIVQFDEALHRLEQTLAQAGFVRAAGRRGNEVDVRLAQHSALFGEGHAPGRTFAFGEALLL